MKRDVVRGAEQHARLTLLATPRLGAPTALELLMRHGNAHAALTEWRNLHPRESAMVNAAVVRERVERTLRVVTAEGIDMIWFDDHRYPAQLAQRLDRFAPPVLFARGNLALLQTASIAVVGCRRASNYGLDVAEQLGNAVGRLGGCVVSGLALGIDAAAQRAALDAGGATVGVLGCGIDVYYPRENTTLQDRVATEGLLLSELLPGEPPLKHHFPHRNRIIAALSQVVVVVEATEKSGALKTAEHALNQGTAVFVVPNALDHPNVQGNLALIRDGAAVYTGARDLLEHVNLLEIGEAIPHARDETAPPANGLHQHIWSQLSGAAQHIDVLAAAVGLPATRVLVALLELELDGRVCQLPGSRFARAAPRRSLASVH